MERNKVKKVKNSKGDVYLYEGDVDLENCQYSIYQNTTKTGQITLYHYTDATGAAGIKKDKVIKGSTEKTPEKNRRHGCGKSLVCLLLYR